MNAEFLQNFKVGDAPLPKEIIDAILAENDRDVTAAVKPYADYEAIKEQLTAASVTYHDLHGDQTRQFYCSQFPANLRQIVEDGQTLWSGISFNLHEI